VRPLLLFLIVSCLAGPPPPVHKRVGLDATLKLVVETLSAYPPALDPLAAMTKWEKAYASECAPEGRWNVCTGPDRVTGEIEDTRLFIDASAHRTRVQFMFAPFTASKKDLDKVIRTLPGTGKEPPACRPKTGGTLCTLRVGCGEYLIDFDASDRLGMIERSCSTGP